MQTKRLRTRRPTCDSCQILVINNIVCHETGCPRAAMLKRKCKICGNNFTPKHRHHQEKCRDCSH